jgi:hypothetical protein
MHVNSNPGNDPRPRPLAPPDWRVGGSEAATVSTTKPSEPIARERSTYRRPVGPQGPSPAPRAQRQVDPVLLIRYGNVRRRLSGTPSGLMLGGP